MTRRLPSPASAPKRHDEARSTTGFRAVEVHAPNNACAAARNLDGERYLCAEAPLLPLTECDRAERCKCSYRHRQDRRSSQRRDHDVGLPPQRRLDTAEQRRNDGRRVSDGKAAFEALDDDPLADTYYDFIAGKIRD